MDVVNLISIQPPENHSIESHCWKWKSLRFCKTGKNGHSIGSTNSYKISKQHSTLGLLFGDSKLSPQKLSRLDLPNFWNFLHNRKPPNFTKFLNLFPPSFGLFIPLVPPDFQKFPFNPNLKILTTFATQYIPKLFTHFVFNVFNSAPLPQPPTPRKFFPHPYPTQSVKMLISPNFILKISFSQPTHLSLPTTTTPKKRKKIFLP